MSSLEKEIAGLKHIAEFHSESEETIIPGSGFSSIHEYIFAYKARVGTYNSRCIFTDNFLFAHSDPRRKTNLVYCLNQEKFLARFQDYEINIEEFDWVNFNMAGAIWIQGEYDSDICDIVEDEFVRCEEMPHKEYNLISLYGNVKKKKK